MENSDSPDISWFDQVKIQTEVLLPVLEALRLELGPEKANKLVYEALRNWMKSSFNSMAGEIEGSPREKWHAITEEIEPTYVDDLDIEEIRNDEIGWEFNVTGCKFAEYFRSLNEPVLGAVLNCECDFHVAEIGKPEVSFSRNQTIMSGGSCCDFRYAFNTKEDQ